MKLIIIIIIGLIIAFILFFGYILYLMIRSSVTRKIRQRKFDSYINSKKDKYKNLN